MIPAPVPSSQPCGWRSALRDAVTSPDELVELCELDSTWVRPARAAAQRFPLRVPREFIARMRRGDPADPLLRQVLPLACELEECAGFVDDPVGDLDARAGRGLLRKYEGRALLIATGACAVHCRYCFRRNFPYGEESATRSGFTEALRRVQADESLNEIILSGGDPLTLSDRRLAGFAHDLQGIAHVKRLRIHTRLPVVVPQRIDEEFLNWWTSLSIDKVLVIHANHAREIDSCVRESLARLRDGRTVLLNQTVLLRGVNDDSESLIELSEILFESGVLPYYLHLLDPVSGAHHFDVPEAEARDYVSKMSERLPGYLVPRLVREIPGAPAKAIVPLVSR